MDLPILIPFIIMHGMRIARQIMNNLISEWEWIYQKTGTCSTQIMLIYVVI